ncbi:DASH family cryptochrome [Marinospirillum sp. MEB164]|uniref:Cryptochrome DASH n=1 Tax=Marinospirillum alkalitolerans TaxID=3123374 RepID=A0ABW8Q0U7_9GAMM
MAKTGLLLLTQDMRLSDHVLLQQAAAQCDRLLLVYLLDPAWLHASAQTQRRLGAHRQAWLAAHLRAFQARLPPQQQLYLLSAPWRTSLRPLLEACSVSSVWMSEPVADEESRAWHAWQQAHPEVRFYSQAVQRLWSLQALPFDLADLPPTFTQFRRCVEALPVSPPVPAVASLPEAPHLHSEQLSALRLTPIDTRFQLPASEEVQWPDFLRHGRAESKLVDTWAGEQGAQAWMAAYFASGAAQQYKQTRNALDGVYTSTHFSPWLALGSLSPRQILQALRCYEAEQGANESTYWIYFELLWREYFQLYALRHGAALFHFGGIQGRAPLTSFYPQRFKAWCEGETPWPLVNACMQQLKQIGWMSNRGRQLVASCLVNELQIDWRYGAAWFEQQLIDYDPASNWGNWQYLAGVGADPRGLRRFDLAKQAATYDPQGQFTQRWAAEHKVTPLYSVDAADWPYAP